MSTTTSADLARTARLFHALSDETRLRIVQMLQRGECCVCDLTGALDAAQSRLSFHLKTLREAGLVSDRRCGRWVYYSLVPGTLEELSELALGLRPTEEAWTPQGEGCCR
jgi:ArsR family transcriptional regulator, arsenate/arsenite/antimonite-responsive transcriptional repressor